MKLHKISSGLFCSYRAGFFGLLHCHCELGRPWLRFHVRKG